MASSTIYLYNIDPKQLIDMSYLEAIKFKIVSARALLKDNLLVPHYMSRDTKRINAVYKAIKFNESLLEELKC